jgi:hypothetical protein
MIPNEILRSLFIQNIANIVFPHNIRENTILGVKNPSIYPLHKQYYLIHSNFHFCTNKTLKWV